MAKGGKLVAYRLNGESKLDKSWLQLSHPLPQEGLLELLSPAGRVALRRELARGTAVARVELSWLPAGLYFWRLPGCGGRVEAAGRLVKGE